ncbi:protein translocase subunit SecY [Clostridium tepidiprofundi DSM 19306]|uniref:Protein translocase subunit SecY n=1 Tax=Clostridium tepidiprofundi DSM 19306 TaxID=1121338 RepID=A0A151B5K9_9CLOT|nr:preprotein translocase subunit SecY [Clostridium tepidiprofundi]KYH35198.1 protein translocase subunit SecY [Clostridium tepidiprofundi DSM 19306]
MLSTLRNAWKVPELRKRILFTFMLIAFFRMGNFIPVPGVDTSKLVQLTNTGNLFSFYDMLSGGAFKRFSIFAMSVTPYINASIIMQLLTVAIPYLENLQKEGQEGRKKIQNYTKYASVAFGILMAFGFYALIAKYGALADYSKFTLFLIVLTMTTGSIFLVWLGEQITTYGIGNGVSLIIFVNIISRFPGSVVQIANLQKTGTVTSVEVVMFIVVALALLLLTIIVNLAERRIPVQYAGKALGTKMVKGQSTHIPINVNSASVIAIIFALSVMQFPNTLSEFLPNSAFTNFIKTSPYSVFRPNSWLYALLYSVLIILFTWFYTQITFKPDEMAENMHKSSGFIPGIRPGEPTARYIERILTNIAVLGGCFAAVIAVFPIILEGYTDFTGIAFGGTALLILVGVATETVRQLESQLVMRNYRGFLK